VSVELIEWVMLFSSNDVSGSTTNLKLKLCIVRVWWDFDAITQFLP